MNVALSKSGEWNGRILDVGGTKQPLPSYRASLHLTSESAVTCVNIDAESQPDLIADAATMPVADASFDHAWCFNLLEHVSDPFAVMKEIARVTKPGGRIAVFTPFLVHVHGHPQDYWRYTDTSLRQLAEHAGLQAVEITPMGGGPFLAGVAQMQTALLHVVFVPMLFVARILDRLFRLLKPGRSSAWPLGYLLMAKR
jgi:SAM-dependent methyltransferase